ncbi:MAG: PTS sugar transporter subunit IIB [Gemmatimonadota bacterium]
MTVVLYRVDERLIHGQVVIGWGSHLSPQHYVVVDDGLAASEWEQELYLLALPEGVDAEFDDVVTARERLSALEEEERRSVVLTRDIETMLRMARGGLLRGRAVNLGGIHHAGDRTRVRPWLHLDEADRERIRELTEEGVNVSGRDLPGSGKVGLDDLTGTE